MASLCSIAAMARTVEVSSPDGQTKVIVSDTDGKVRYSVSHNGETMLQPSPLGLKTDVGNFTDGMTLAGDTVVNVSDSYSVPTIKKNHNSYEARQLRCDFRNPDGRRMTVVFNVSDNNVALRYEIPHQDGKGSIRILKELTGFSFPIQTTVFLTPQSDAMIGWKRTKPSYEEEYIVDAPLDSKSKYAHGFTFPSLFRIGDDGWVLLSETDVDSRYCGSRLSDVSDGIYTIEFPMPEENNGNGTSEPAFALPGHTPWRTITVGNTLAPIVETTVMWDVVSPRYEASTNYEPDKGTWSWILWQDNSINFEDQKKFIDLAHDMGFKYALVDAAWDKNIGYDKMPELIKYARSKNIDLLLWYSSSGYWNDIQQSPINKMDNSIIRKKEMKWLKDNGVKGIKVDFFGGDKQETMRLYEEILSDANDNELMVIFHGCTLPRGWERMYPNYIGSEAVLASENLVFSQHFCDNEAFNATIHPFIRNASGSMEFGGTFLNKRLNRGNDGGTTRKTTDAFQLATAVLFQNPQQNFALAPNNLTDANPEALDFMRNVPTLWDDVEFIEGYPGRYVVLSRRSGDKLYIVGINAEKKPKKISLIPEFEGKNIMILSDGKEGALTQKNAKLNNKGINVTMQPNGGFVAVIDITDK